MVGSISGGTVTVTEANGSATVNVGPTTKVTRFVPGQLSDITAGECLMVNPTKDSAAPPAVTAAAIIVGAPTNGHCGPKRPGRRVGGTVASVNGNSVVMTTADNSQTTVTVTASTRYTKRVPADGSAIAVGQCLTARGQKDNSGALQVTDVDLRAANNGQCGAGHRGG